MILVTGFEPFGGHPSNPSEEIAKAVDGRVVGGLPVRAVILPVHHVEAGLAARRLLHEHDPLAVLHVGLAAGRARIALERVAVNVMDYEVADNAGYQTSGEPCVPGGPAAYLATLPLRAILEALTREGVPAYLSNTAGTYLCNQTLYATLHAIFADRRRALAGFCTSRSRPRWPPPRGSTSRAWIPPSACAPSKRPCASSANTSPPVRRSAVRSRVVRSPGDQARAFRRREECERGAARGRGNRVPSTRPRARGGSA